MEIRLYYGKTPTKQAKLFTREDFMDWFNRLSQNSYVSIQTDEKITPFFNFIDIEEPENFNYIWNYSYIGFITNEGENARTFFADIDRVENSPFETTKNMYRVYFTVDWWSTVQYSYSFFNSIFNHIRGDVDRAHVNDWKVNGSAYSVDLSYTDTTMEEDVTMWQMDSGLVSESELVSHEAILPVGQRMNIQFLHVLYRGRATTGDPPALLTGGKGAIARDSTGNYTVPIPFFLAVIPTYKGKFIKFTTNGSSNYFNADIQNIGATAITGDEPVAMFFSNVTGLSWTLKRDTSDNSYYVDILHDDSILNKSFSINTGDQQCVGVTYNEIPPSFFPNDYLIPGINATFSDDTFQPFNSLESFKNIGMSKAISEPYRIFGLVSAKGGLILHPQFMNAQDNAEIVNSLNTGCQYIILKDSSRQGVAQIHLFEGDNTFNVFTQQNWYDEKYAKLTAISNVLNPIIAGYQDTANTVTNSYHMLNSDDPDYVGAQNATFQHATRQISRGFEIAKARVKAADIFREIALGGNVQISSNYEGVTFTTTALKWYYLSPLYDNNYDEIKEHLRLYGYTTYLEPRDVLVNHRRKYFNYIKTSNLYLDFNANITGDSYNSITANIRDYISDMLDNGVFLFRSVGFTLTEFMSFDVINMQEGLIDDTE